ncbi:hypothetical protein CROQUDRAFT_87474 [Cronartium quercuum f. sp. fusiforme G11]|uniref:Uncharacterized protein n=1 Tax=Cronartium quercuum f. sp. fusiforme G11 TaxID=708437 RepID=A0A9P6NS58_9BASI|nr:hypothetical protein CROQUDRAFT_87474 [Cronartium quercuum f. sp. fusiforme G11]
MENQQITNLVLASSTHSTMMLTNDQLEGIVAAALRKQAEESNSQIEELHLPQDYQSTKNCLFIHICLLWGLIEQSSVPALPPPTIITKFENQFSSIKQILDLDINSSAPEIISQADVQTLWDGRSEKIKTSCGLLHIPEDLIWYVHAHFAKLGIQCWGPNLAKGPKSLFNSSMHIAALSTFRMFASHGAYNFLKLNYSQTLCYRSNAADVFFRCLDAEMEKSNLASGKKSQGAKRSTFGLLQLHPDHNPDEKLSDKNFTRKFLDEVMTKYGFAEQEENFEEEEDENDEGMVGVEGSIDLEATSPEDFEDDLYGVREWGNAYNSEDDKDWGGDDGNWKSNGSDGAEDEEGEDMYNDM